MIPKPNHPIADGKPIDRYWYAALQRLASSVLSQADVQALVNAAIAGSTSSGLTIHSTDTITASGDSSGGYRLRLAALSDTGVGTALWKFTRDNFGRVSGTQSANTDDLAEGITNLYHTAERAQDAVGAAIAAGAGDGVTLAYDDSGNKINATNTDKGSVAVAGHVADTDPHPQYTTTAEASAAAPVQSVAGRVGNVTLTNADISGLGNSATKNVGTVAGTVAAGDDARFTDAREWTASTVTQAIAEAGTDSTRTAWTAERVRQGVKAHALDLQLTDSAASTGPELITNGGFATSSAGWTLDAGITWSTGLVTVAASTTARIRQNISVVNGERYYITCSTNRSTGWGNSTTARLGGVVGATLTNYSGQYPDAWVLLANTTGTVEFSIEASVAGSSTVALTNVSCKKLIAQTAQKLRDSSAVIRHEIRANKGNTITGVSSGRFMMTADNNVAVGQNASEQSVSGMLNVAVGDSALRSNVLGQFNTAIGASAGSSIFGGGNTVAGYKAGYAIGCGNSNTLMGRECGAALYNSNNNTAIGYQACFSLTGATQTVAVGSGALSNATTDTYTVAVGASAGSKYGAGGSALTSSSGNIFIGADSRASALGTNNEVVIGTSAIGSGTNSVTLGRSSNALVVATCTTLRVTGTKTPASATAAGTTGDVCWDSNYVYVCVATNTWKRAALSTW